MFDTRKIPALTKTEIRELKGGRIRGMKLFLAVSERDSSPELVYFATLRGQCKSQTQSSAHPEGFEPFITGIGTQLEYDIATETVGFPIPVRSGATWAIISRRRCRLLMPSNGSMMHEMLMRLARIQELRDRVLKLIMPGEEEVVANLMREQLGFGRQATKSRQPRIIIVDHYLDELSPEQLVDLIDLLSYGTVPAPPLLRDHPPLGVDVLAA
jgi:hypothetical protein